LLIKFRQLNPEEKYLNNETLNKRIYRFLKRYNLSIRRPTYIGREIYANTFKIADDFINKLIKLKNICNFTNDLIILKIKKVFYTFNENACCTAEVMIDWINQVWKNYIFSLGFQFNSLLI